MDMWVIESCHVFAGEKKTEAEADGMHQARFDRKGIIGR